MSQSSLIRSTFILTIAAFISKLVGSAFRIPLQNIAGDEVLGIFSLVFPVYMVALLLSVAGIPLAISKLIAESNQPSAINEIYITAKILALTFGVISFSGIYVFSGEIANLLGGPKTELALIVVALTLLVAPYMAVYRGFFQGHDDMRPTAISQVIEQLTRVSFTLIIAYLLVARNYSNERIVGYMMIGSVVGAVASLLYLKVKHYQTGFRITTQKKYTFSIFTRYSKTILNLSIPIAIGSLAMALFNVVDSFTISYALRSIGTEIETVNYLYGIYGRGLTISQMTTIFATSIVLPIVPLISTKLAEKDSGAVKRIIEKVHYMTHLISWPAAVGLVALTLPLNLALFTNLEGSSVIAMMSFSSVFAALSIIGTGILQGTNFAKLAAFIIIGAALGKALMNIYLVPHFGLNGAALSTLLVYFLMFLLNTIYIFKHFKYSFLSPAILKIGISSLVIGVVVGVPTFYINFASSGRGFSLLYVSVALIIGGAIYLALLLMFKVVDKQDFRLLKRW
ncbi:putative polysaccharide biosynthesis protein [Oceanobacillus sp. CAU 1775]